MTPSERAAEEALTSMFANFAKLEEAYLTVQRHNKELLEENDDLKQYKAHCYDMTEKNERLVRSVKSNDKWAVVIGTVVGACVAFTILYFN